MLGDLLETHTGVVAHHHHLALLLRKQFDQVAHVAFDLRGDQFIFDRLFRETQRSQYVVAAFAFIDLLVLLAGAEVVDHLVVRDTQNPRKELAVVGVAAFVDDAYDFDECFLEDVVRYVVVLDHHVNIVPNPTLVALDQFGNGTLITRTIIIKQVLVA